MEQTKRLPYGVCDFRSVREENLYYVDKTMYLSKLEEVGRFLFFIRPRRFGKSLFLSMMRAYYDKSMCGHFQQLFDGLWAGQHPTPTQGRYQVMYFDFSRVTGDSDTLEEDFNAYCRACVMGFIDQYADDYPAETVAQVKALRNAREQLNIINIAAQKLHLPLYLIVDEYDNFTNVVLNKQGEDVYRAITHADGFYRGVFKLFKGMFERIFLIGVSPVTLDDLTSGFNIALNVSTDFRFNDMLGFTTDDVRQLIAYYKDNGRLPETCDVEATLEAMKPWYDNYCFSNRQLEKESRVFNPDMTLNYLNIYIGTGAPPEQMLDPNTKTDYNKMRRLLQLDTLSGERRSVIRKIAEEGQIVGTIADSFPANKLTDPNMFISLLFYYGMLTIRDTRGAALVLGIPNNNVRKQYYSYLMEEYQRHVPCDEMQLAELYYLMAYEGNWQQALGYIAERYSHLSSVRDSIEGERNIQGFFLAYLNLSPYYLTAPELELSHGFCDFFLLPDLTRYPSSHSYILELKYLPHKDYADRAEAQWAEAVQQIHKYAQAPRVEQLRQGTHLHKIIMQFEGWELRRMEEIL